MDRHLEPSGFALRVILSGLLLAVPAHAYVDPNAQSLLTQVLTPLLVIVAAGLTFLRKEAGSAVGWLANRIRGRKN